MFCHIFLIRARPRYITFISDKRIKIQPASIKLCEMALFRAAFLFSHFSFLPLGLALVFAF